MKRPAEVKARLVVRRAERRLRKTCGPKKKKLMQQERHGDSQLQPRALPQMIFRG